MVRQVFGALANIASLDNICVIADVKAQGVGGGGATAGSWFTRDLNTIITGAVNIIGLASNRIELFNDPYLVIGAAPSFATDTCQARLQDVTSAATFGNGPTLLAPVATSNSALNWCVGRIVPAVGNTEIELQQQVLTTNGASGAGILGFSNVEVYGFVILFRLTS